jgi:hypothetical protein
MCGPEFEAVRFADPLFDAASWAWSVGFSVLPFGLKQHVRDQGNSKAGHRPPKVQRT